MKNTEFVVVSCFTRFFFCLSGCALKLIFSGHSMLMKMDLLSLALFSLFSLSGKICHSNFYFSHICYFLSNETL